MITKRERWLMQEAFDSGYNCGNLNLYESFDDFYTDDEINCLLDDAPDNWISVNDGLPAYGEPVLIKVNEVIQHITYMLDEADDAQWFEPYHYHDLENAFPSHKVDSWQPIESPKEQK